ncbi:RNA-binding protein [Blastocystis sp. subtype 4]|uniref:RNA-binding protein n=1 Tax=Blastocystis sp. subtype 4 TaxID=944170 RepID=UPI0007121FDC|nr:RNA-binding protein [Blastocystis sp. subtype 4]KNB42840.1 RNA-binding protein [Blastocystis sp. subtype 4]|eukprot:XP_014526283.1 RNA-binding protein [Blastocystis sp. subtype 4]
MDSRRSCVRISHLRLQVSRVSILPAMGSFSDRLIQTIMELVSLYLTVELLDPHSLTPQAGRTSFTPGPALYMNDYISDSGYSPRPQLSPITSPYPEPELSPRRLYSSQSSRLMNPYSWCGWIICRSESTRIQRTLSTITPSSSLGASIPATSSLEIPMGYHSQQSFKRKESMKSAAWQNGDIESYRGHIKEMSRDHNGCRALQQSLDNCPEKVVSMIYDEVGNELTDLMMDSFGNYLFQKLLDVSSPEQRREVLKKVKSRIVDASYNVHGTRSVQRLIQVCNEPDMVQDIMDALRGHIAALSSHSNGNHVIQRCLQHMPEEYRVYVFEEVVKSCVEISTHRHGCCVVQRCLDSAPKKYHDMLLDAIVDHSVDLICNPFGNYVIQYLIEHGEASESERITRCVLGKVANLSCQKYSSNVIEKILVCATPSVRGEIVDEIATSPDLHNLLHDKFANYVIQKALKLGNDEQRQQLLKAIRPYEEELSKSTGGRHILSQLNEISTPNSQNWSRM